MLNKINYIQYLCEQKLKVLNLDKDSRYTLQLERELSNIDVQDIHDYILNFIKTKTKIEKHSSLVYFLLDISQTDPIKNNIPLIVKKQSSFPDIDSDFSMDEREMVVKYFINKYGSDHVAPIGSYGQMKMKMVTRDVARIFDIDLNDTNDVVKNLGDDVDTMSEEEFDIMIQKEPGDEHFRKDLYDLRKYFERHPDLRDIIFKLKGQLRHLTKHPAGVVATPGRIDESIPLMRHKDELITSWVDGIIRKDLQSSGFIKFDILGLKTLTIVKQILELIRYRKSYSKEVDFDLETIDNNQLVSLLYEEFSSKLPLDGNEKVYEKFRETDTNGIFQFECLSGNTWIGSYKLAELYNTFVKDPMSVTKIGCVDIKNRKQIRQRIAAMQKKTAVVYRLVLENNMCIDATLLHEFFAINSRRGKWIKLEDLKVGNTVMIDYERDHTQYYCETQNIAVNIFAGCKECKECIKKKQRNCKPMMLSKFSKKKYEIRYRYIKIKLIYRIGERDVYDIGFTEKQKHNYVANGFVVHNSSLMKSLLKEIKPTTFSDITSATALGRPGPLDTGMHHEYSARKHGKQFDFGSPLIEKCLKQSYGILVYQEDVMRLCNIVAGFPLDLTDTVRKNLMKSVRDTDAKDKSVKQRKEIHEKFIKGCVANGLAESTAESWWQNCVSFARYGFNKCLTGDTVLTRCNGNQHTERNITIRELYSTMREKSCVGRKYRLRGYPKIHAMIDGRIKIDKISDIIFNGSKPVFRITTECGFSIKATDIHRFLSEVGWKIVKDFQVDDLIAVTFQEYDGYKRKGYSDRVKGKVSLNYNDGPGFGEEDDNPAYIDGRSILKHESIDNLKKLHTICQDCNRPHKRLEVHHVKRLIECNYDRLKYHDESNMKVLCPSCHKKRHYAMGRTKRYEKGFEITFDKIISVEYVGLEDTYDVEMCGEEHNFVANGFISHNSHAVAYTVLSYQMMWFKIYYPLEFFVVLFSNSLKEKFPTYFAEAMAKNIKIVPADINKAGEGFTIHGEDNSIMFGLGHIMGAGPAAVNAIVKTQPFASFEQFWDKTSQVKKVSKSVILALINAHAFDCFGTQNEILKKYFKEIRKDKKWECNVDYDDKRYEHEQFVESYGLDWRAKLTDKHKQTLKSLGVKLLAKLVQPKARYKEYVWGIVTEIINKTSKNGNNYYYVMLTDSKFNVAKVRLPIYNKRCQKALVPTNNGKYKKVPIADVVEVNNILVGEVETSEYMDRIFIDMFDVCCIGNVYEKSDEQKEKLAQYDTLHDED